MAVSHGKHKYDYEIVDGEGLIPEGTEVVKTLMFRRNKNLVMVKIPESVVSIAAGTFFGCSNLKTIKIDSSVILIEYRNNNGVFYRSDTPPFPNLIDVVVKKGWTINLRK